MSSDDQATCGKGLAAHAPLPAKLGQLTDAVATILEGHIAALDLTDANARKERDAYEALVREHRATAAQLEATAQDMTGYRDLPMAKHDMQIMSLPSGREAFRAFVRREEELVALLLARLEKDRAMLSDMGAQQ